MPGLRPALLDELCCIRDLAGCGLALIGDTGTVSCRNSTLMTLGRYPQVAGRIGMTVDLKTVARGDTGLIAAAPLGRTASRRELKHLAEAAAGPGGLHALRWLLARAWMIALTDKRREIDETDIKAVAGD